MISIIFTSRPISYTYLERREYYYRHSFIHTFSYQNMSVASRKFQTKGSPGKVLKVMNKQNNELIYRIQIVQRNTGSSSNYDICLYILLAFIECIFNGSFFDLVAQGVPIPLDRVAKLWIRPCVYIAITGEHINHLVIITCYFLSSLM